MLNTFGELQSVFKGWRGHTQFLPWLQMRLGLGSIREDSMMLWPISIDTPCRLMVYLPEKKANPWRNTVNRRIAVVRVCESIAQR